MTYPAHLIEQSKTLIRKDLSLHDQELQHSSVSDNDLYESLKKQLAYIVQHLLDTNPNHLLNALYRIDLNEDRLKKVFAECLPESIADNIATLIIDRQIQKIIIRAKYSQ